MAKTQKRPPTPPTPPSAKPLRGSDHSGNGMPPGMLKGEMGKGAGPIKPGLTRGSGGTGYGKGRGGQD
jgi:hypothetical protein